MRRRQARRRILFQQGSDRLREPHRHATIGRQRRRRIVEHLVDERASPDFSHSL
jgi:hypothetical protein